MLHLLAASVVFEVWYLKIDLNMDRNVSVPSIILCAQKVFKGYL